MRKSRKSQSEVITLETPLLNCGFSFNQKFRDYFSAVTGASPFKFNADMATAWRKVKRDNDLQFTIQDMIKSSHQYANKLTVAAILWREVRDSKDEKVYSKQLLKEHSHKIEAYRK